LFAVSNKSSGSIHIICYKILFEFLENVNLL